MDWEFVVSQVAIRLGMALLLIIVNWLSKFTVRYYQQDDRNKINWFFKFLYYLAILGSIGIICRMVFVQDTEFMINFILFSLPAIVGINKEIQIDGRLTTEERAERNKLFKIEIERLR